MYVSNQIRATNLSLESPFHEHLWLSIPLRGNDSLWIGCIYRRPSSNLEISTEYLCDLLTSATKSCSHLLICGDFNYANINWSDCIESTRDPHAQCFLDTLHDLILYQHVDVPTRYRDSQSFNTLDLVITNEEHMINEISYLPALGLSDHICMQFSFLCYIEKSNNKTPSFNWYHVVDYDALQILLTGRMN